MPALEEKLVHLACAKLFPAISAQDLRECSDGSRPGRGALEAVRDLTVALPSGVYGSGVAVDVQGFFDQVDHPWLVDMLRGRIDDRALLPLIRPGRKAGGVEPAGHVVQPAPGTPQGGPVSPVLAHASGHDALALGFPKGVKAHSRGDAL